MKLPGASPPRVRQEAPDERSMSLIEHLGELRSRLIRSAVAVAVGTGVGFWIAPDIRRQLVELLPSCSVRVLGPADAFAITFDPRELRDHLITTPSAR